MWLWWLEGEILELKTCIKRPLLCSSLWQTAQRSSGGGRGGKEESEGTQERERNSHG